MVPALRDLCSDVTLPLTCHPLPSPVVSPPSTSLLPPPPTTTTDVSSDVVHGGSEVLGLCGQISIDTGRHGGVYLGTDEIPHAISGFVEGRLMGAF